MCFVRALCPLAWHEICRRRNRSSCKAPISQHGAFQRQSCKTSSHANQTATHKRPETDRQHIIGTQVLSRWAYWVSSGDCSTPMRDTCELRPELMRPTKYVGGVSDAVRQQQPGRREHKESNWNIASPWCAYAEIQTQADKSA